MKCPYCAVNQTVVIDTRDAEDEATVRRRRQCEECQKRFTTYERAEGVDLVVVKKDGRREQFSRDKLRRGIVKATWKRPVTMAQIEELIDGIERSLRQKTSTEIKSWEVGNMVIRLLKRLDPLSYLLFASVYRDFNDLQDFREELEKLEGKEQQTQGE